MKTKNIGCGEYIDKEDGLFVCGSKYDDYELCDVCKAEEQEVSFRVIK